MRIILVLISFLFFKPFVAQNYGDIPVKEEYDLYNTHEVNVDHKPCTADPNNDAGTFGDGMSKLIEGYIAMYKATGDKAYLYKFILQSLCMMENRHDLNASATNNDPRWSFDPQMYQDGYIIATFSRFIYFVKLEEPSLFNEPVHQFDELNPTNYAANTCNCNNFGITFSTFGQYANWLQDRVGETLWWYLTNGYWSNSWGMLQEATSNATGVSINMQVGFGRALLFIGLTASEQSFLDKAETIANLFKGNVNFYDPCEDEFYNAKVLRATSDNAYWWYHSGWSIPRRDCGVWTGFPPSFNYYLKAPSHSGFVEYFEDISHGAIVTWLPLDFYHFQPSTPFISNDMVRLRNMFSKKVYDGSGNFHNAVNGQDGPICAGGNDCEPKNPPISYFAHESRNIPLNYMLLAEFDGADGTATAPDVYDIVFDYYVNNIQGSTTSPYGGQNNKGHAEIVQAQWIRECPSLTLYNRKIVYNQDFRVEGTLTVAPEETPGNSYAEPIISDQVFTAEPGTTVNMVAGESIVLKPGTHIKAGSDFHASIDTNLCSNTKNLKTYGNESNENDDNYTISKNVNETLRETQIAEKPNYLFKNSLNVYPNPFDNNTLIQFTLQKTSNVTLTVFDNFGRTVFNQIVDRELKEGIYNIPFSGNNLPSGFYQCILTIDNQTQLTSKIVKQ